MADDAEFVVVSGHAGDQWQDRRRCNPGYGPVVAWNRGERVPEPHGHVCDEARYHAETDTVLLVHDAENSMADDDRVLATVLAASTAGEALRSSLEVIL